MTSLPDAYIRGLAKSCVSGMGDVFWDFSESRDAPLGYVEPSEAAMQSVANALHEFATILESNRTYTIALRLEYRELVKRLGHDPDDADVVASLVSEAAWTERGACALLQLARTYGTSVLRNALGLAEALGIEDGESAL